MRKCRGVNAIILTLCIFFTAFISCFTAGAENLIPNRFNVVLVVDASTSLKNGGAEVDGSEIPGSDMDGLRYEAIAEFLALLANNGNKVGAVVFHDRNRYEEKNITIISNEDGTLIAADDDNEMTSTQKKMQIEKEIRHVDVNGETDIGLAMEKAVELLQTGGDNKLPSVILLFTDGVTQIYTPKEFDDEGNITEYLYINGEKIHDNTQENESHVKLAAAQDTAMAEGYQVYVIRLDTSGEKKEDWENIEIKSLETLANKTNGQYMEVNSAEKLEEVFLTFYDMIYNVRYESKDEQIFDSNRKIKGTFFVSHFTPTEVNIFIKGQPDAEGNYDDEYDYEFKCLADKNHGDILYRKNDSNIREYSTESKRFLAIKIVNPESGVYEYEITGKPGTSGAKVKIDVSYDRFITSDMELSSPESGIIETNNNNEDINVYYTNENMTVTARLYEKIYDKLGNPLNNSYYDNYSAAVNLYEADENGKKTDGKPAFTHNNIRADGDKFEYTIPLVGSGYYVVETVISEEINSDLIDTDAAPLIVEKPIKVEVRPNVPIKASKIKLQPNKESYSPSEEVNVTAGLEYVDSGVSLTNDEYNSFAATVTVKKQNGDIVFEDTDMTPESDGFKFTFKQTDNDTYTVITTIVDNSGTNTAPLTESTTITVKNQRPEVELVKRIYQITPWSKDKQKVINLADHVFNPEEGEELLYEVLGEASDFDSDEYELHSTTGELILKHIKSGSFIILVYDSGNAPSAMTVTIKATDIVFRIVVVVIATLLLALIACKLLPILLPKKLNGEFTVSTYGRKGIEIMKNDNDGKGPWDLNALMGDYIDEKLEKANVKIYAMGGESVRVKSKQQVYMGGDFTTSKDIGVSPVLIQSDKNAPTGIYVSFKPNKKQ